MASFIAQFAFIFFIYLAVGINAGKDLGEVLTEGLVGKTQREFDYFQLALQWPGTYCRRTRRCCSSNGCCRGTGAPAEFTIHGLWPDYNDGTWPSCCTGKKIDAKEVSTLLGSLDKYWPTLSCGSTSNCHGGKGLFWEHEQVLREAGYVASNSEKYPLGGIVSAIQNAFHTTPEIECSGDAVEELNLCFYKDFKPRDCAIKSNIGRVNAKKCPKYVSLPEYTSLKHGATEAEVSQSALGYSSI